MRKECICDFEGSMEELAAGPAAGEVHRLRTPRPPRSSSTCDLMSSAQCRGQGGRESWGESRLPFDATRPPVKGDINKTLVSSSRLAAKTGIPDNCQSRQSQREFKNFQVRAIFHIECTPM